MPLPKPKKNEEKQPFISRCIAKVTKEDADKFPDRKQRAAICYSQWDGNEKDGKKSTEKRIAQVILFLCEKELPRQRRNSGEAAAPGSGRF